MGEYVNLMDMIMAIWIFYESMDMNVKSVQNVIFFMKIDLDFPVSRFWLFLKGVFPKYE